MATAVEKKKKGEAYLELLIQFFQLLNHDLVTFQIHRQSIKSLLSFLIIAGIFMIALRQFSLQGSKFPFLFCQSTDSFFILKKRGVCVCLKLLEVGG